jgi:AraC-like DNA-binding protein
MPRSTDDVASPAAAARFPVRLWDAPMLPGVQLYAGPAQSYSRSIHPEYKVAVAPAAGLRIERRGTSYLAPPGHLLVLNPNDAHSGRLLSDEPCAWRVICIPPELLSDHVGGSSGTLGFSNPVVADPSLIRDFLAIWDTFNGKRSLGWEVRFLEFVGRACGGAPAKPEPAGDHAARAAMARLRGYLDQHMTRNVSLEELSRVTGLSRYGVVRACGAFFGIPPHALLHALRLERARQLLQQGAPPAAVAAATGYFDQSHLSKAFVRRFGMPPGRFQRSCLNPSEVAPPALARALLETA